MDASTLPIPFPPRTRVVAVVGGGFCGTLVAVNLARLARGRDLRVVLFERRERFARGVAYDTNCPQHLLNVPAGMMSAFADEPDHFLSWLEARDPEAHRGTFAPRRVYGEYLEALLQTSVDGPGPRIDLVRDEVVDIIEGASGRGLTLVGRDGCLRADEAVLALGNPPPQDPIPGPHDPRIMKRYVSNPWDEGPFDGLARDDSLLLIGSGLTAVDLIVAAKADGFRGPIAMVSRHGLLPMAHAPAPPRPHYLPPKGPSLTARTLLREAKQEARRCTLEGGDWRSVVDSFRPVIQEIWRSLDEREKRRFLRHLGSRWEVHRHRVAPEVARIVDESRARGQLKLIAGRIQGLEDRGEAIGVRVLPRGKSEAETLLAHRVINCTGPSRDIRAGHPPLVKSLVERGLCRPDPLGMGLEMTDAGALVASDGQTSGRLFALGPLFKGQLWETTAVRELRVQARELARHLVVAERGVESCPSDRLEVSWG